MGVPRIGVLVVAVAVTLSMSVIGCDPTMAPDDNTNQTTIEKPKSDHQVGRPDSLPGRGNSNKNMPAVPIRGRFKASEPVWIVSHFSEQGCGGLVAGAEVRSKGNVSHLGLSSVDASAAWDWSVHAAGDYLPVGPTTGPSATLLGTYPYDFCSAPQSASGEVQLVAASGDELHGVVMGGEVYELGFDTAGDGQEQFLVVRVDGGTGRFRHARGEFVLHLMARFEMLEFQVLRSEMLSGGWIQY